MEIGVRCPLFLSTLSLRRATVFAARQPAIRVFLSTLSLRRATGGRVLFGTPSHISIHALLAESVGILGRRLLDLQQFLSTLSLRRATFPRDCILFAKRHFYPRSPCGERPIGAITYVVMTPDFYPRSPCGERPEAATTATKALKFLSTLSLRRATCNRLHPSQAGIHFYPRSPCGERLAASNHCNCC